MRISSQMFFMRNTNSLMQQQADLSQQNIHLSTQKRVIHGSDDPVAIATIQRLKQDVSIGEQYIKNGEMAQSANELSDITLMQSSNILQRVRELMVSGSNGTMNDANREAVALELETLKDELMGVANTRDGNSQYIYAGYQVDTEPFQKNEFGEVEYHGDSGERDYRIGSGVSVSGNDAGDKVFMDIPEGNGSFVSELSSTNTGAGIISEGIVYDENAARDYLDQDYTIAISDPTASGEPDYSVYGLKDNTVTGSASVTISSIDLSDAGISSVDPATDSSVQIQFIATGTDQFEIVVNGQSSLPATYDATDSNSQILNINGISIEVDGVPADNDSYDLTKFVPPTPYEDGQGISFNGIKTEIKGDVESLDAFTLRQSDTKDIFATIQSSIDALRIPGDDQAAKAERATAFSMSLLQVDASLENVTNVLSATGSRLRTIDNQRESTLDFNLATQTTLSSLEDLDMAAAISEFQQQYSMLEVSQKTFVQLQGLSLFSLI